MGALQQKVLFVTGAASGIGLACVERFAREDQTVWGLYNAVTAWQTHEKFKSNANGITALVGRETKVAEMLRSKEWNTLYAL